ncbi:MAG: hypothetical protein KDA28_10575, partial [Phycisphaerales bacterium]|nr:hypothetical protein [Phycisphaerales bacterium]
MQRMRRAWSRELRLRTPSTLVALLLTCALVPLVLWSCQSVRSAGHADLLYGSEPEIRVRLLRARTAVDLEATSISVHDDGRTDTLEGPLLVHAGDRHISMMDRHGFEHIFVERAQVMALGTVRLDGEEAPEVLEFVAR